MRLFHEAFHSVALFFFLLCLHEAALARSFSNISQFSIKPASADATPYLERVSDCLQILERASEKAFDTPLRFQLQKVTLDASTEIAAGSAGPDSLTLFGPPDKATACHEVFHVFEIQASQKKLMARKKTSAGKTSPLYEALPQVFAVLSTGDCLIGREGRQEFAYDHCQLLHWNDLPSLRETATRERRLARSRGAETSYWDAVLNQSTEAQLTQPSAYYMSIPMAAALHKSFPACGQDVLIEALLKTYVEQSHLNNNSFDSIKTFAPAYLRSVEAAAAPACAREVQKNFERLGLVGRY